MIALDQAYQRPNRALLLFARKLLICHVGEKEKIWLADSFGFHLGGHCSKPALFPQFFMECGVVFCADAGAVVAEYVAVQ